MKKLIFIILLFTACQKDEPYFYIDNWNFYESNDYEFISYDVHTNSYFSVTTYYKFVSTNGIDTIISSVYSDDFGTNKDTTVVRKKKLYNNHKIIKLIECSYVTH